MCSTRGPAPAQFRDHGPLPCGREGPVDRQSKAGIAGRSRGRRPRSLDEGLAQFAEARRLQSRCTDAASLLQKRPFHEFGDLQLNQFQLLVVHEIALGDRHDAALNAQQFQYARFRVCGITESSAAMTSNAASTPEAPATIV